ncbi:SPOR domain-containing protein [Parerythrobacter aestuarii]|uniref:SPOR domain-containing protein n=1 Tax=Parerythrobacter aestuarii TaxID=3020909 RepID=UPI0024DE569E|nr:SPOR domain-containing protein [Parerythrobacter aestuarii]
MIARTYRGLLAAALLAVPAAALADVKAGVEAWTAGDYDRAVREWREPAAKGDPDAQFNMAQAYRLGRGVEQNTKQAEVYYAKAAAQGHLKAADNLGLLMFQGGRREEAMPYVKSAADRGDPRAQYLLGIAHFNGDLVEKDWVRAYALLTLANSAGLPQAGPAIQQMDDFIPLEQRQQAQPLAAQIKREADVRRSSQQAAVDLGDPAPATVAAAVPPRPQPAASDATRLPPVAARIPEPIAQTPVAPSVAAAQAAIAEATRVTGTQNPADAGATFAAREGSASASRPARDEAVRVAAAPSALPAAEPAQAPSQSMPAQARTGPWKVQLGAFSVASNADRLWSQLAGRAELSGSSKLLVPAGRVTKLLAGGYASRGEAQDACAALKRSGQDCLVTR